MPNDSFNTYFWDADGNTINLDGMTFTYDAFDRWAERNNGGTISRNTGGNTGGQTERFLILCADRESLICRSAQDVLACEK